MPSSDIIRPPKSDAAFTTEFMYLSLFWLSMMSFDELLPFFKIEPVTMHFFLGSRKKNVLTKESLHTIAFGGFLFLCICWKLWSALCKQALKSNLQFFRRGKLVYKCFQTFLYKTCLCLRSQYSHAHKWPQYLFPAFPTGENSRPGENLKFTFSHR